MDLVLFSETTFVYCENHIKPIRTWAKCGVINSAARGTNGLVVVNLKN